MSDVPRPGDGAPPEMVDVVTADDQVLRQVTRADIRKLNLLHRAVYVVVCDSEGRIFVHRRTETKDIYPGFWDVTIGGVVAAGEKYAEAARRELFEELGIVVAGALEDLGAVRYEDAFTRVVGRAYATVHGGPVTLQADEIVSGGFVTRGEAERLLHAERCCPDGAQVVRAYLGRPAR